MGTGTQDTIAPPPAGFEPEEQQGAPPPPPPGFVPEGTPPPANRGFMGTLADKIQGGLSSLKDAVTSSPTGGYPLTDRRAWFGDKPWSFNPTGEGTIGRQATRPLPKDLNTPMYRAATTLSPLVPGLNPEAMEQASGRGDVGAVAAETAVPLAGLAAGEGGGRLISRLPQGAARLFRGPGGVGEAKIPLTPSSMERELEARVPMNEPPGARDEMYESLADRIMRRGEEQGRIDEANRLPMRAHAEMERDLAARTERGATKSRREALQAGQTAPGPWKPGRLSEQINEEGAEAEGEGTRDRLVNRVTGKRPSPSERGITNIVRSRIVTPEERAMELRELGPESGVKPGEGQMEREARLLGTARARRAAQGMREPK